MRVCLRRFDYNNLNCLNSGDNAHFLKYFPIHSRIISYLTAETVVACRGHLNVSEDPYSLVAR